MTTIADLMTTDPATVSPDDTVLRAAQLMDELNVGSLPVCRGRQVLGIITDRDIAVRATAAGLLPSMIDVDHVMSEGVRCCKAGDNANTVLRAMGQGQIRRMPVVDDDELVGMISLGDLIERQLPGVDETLRRIGSPCMPDRGSPERAAAGPATANAAAL